MTPRIVQSAGIVYYAALESVLEADVSLRAAASPTGSLVPVQVGGSSVKWCYRYRCQRCGLLSEDRRQHMQHIRKFHFWLFACDATTELAKPEKLRRKLPDSRVSAPREGVCVLSSTSSLETLKLKLHAAAYILLALCDEAKTWVSFCTHIWLAPQRKICPAIYAKYARFQVQGVWGSTPLGVRLSEFQAGVIPRPARQAQISRLEAMDKALAEAVLFINTFSQQFTNNIIHSSSMPCPWDVRLAAYKVFALGGMFLEPACGVEEMLNKTQADFELCVSWGKQRWGHLVSFPGLVALRQQLKKLLTTIYQEFNALDAGARSRLLPIETATVEFRNGVKIVVGASWLAPRDGGPIKTGTWAVLTSFAKPCNLVGSQVKVTRVTRKLNWERCWKLLHTREQLAPPECREVWFLLVAFGSFRGSEAVCESIGNLLKYYQSNRKSISTGKAVEKVHLRLADLQGVGEDDAMVQRIMVEMFGGIDKVRMFVAPSQQAKREAKFPKGRGSITIHRYRLKLRAARTWDWARVKRIRRAYAHFPAGSPASATAWRKLAATRRQAHLR